MSSRVLRKLHSEQGVGGRKGRGGLEGSQEEESDPDTESVTEFRLQHQRGGAAGKGNVNPFDLLNQNSPSESEVKEDDDRETEAMACAGNNEDGDQMKQRRKKKKKKKPLRGSSLGGGGGAGSSSSNNKRSSEDNLEDADEIDRTVREVNQLLGDSHHPQHNQRQAQPSEKHLLKVEHKHLNPDNEMKRIFGSRVIQSETTKRRGRGPRSGSFRNLWLVTPKPMWPQVGKAGITMKFIETRHCLQYFAFEHSPQYQEIQGRFLDAVESYNPDNVLEILNVHPYHVDALLQLSDLCRMGEDAQMAVELVERSLYSLESALHPLFSFGAGNCRLEYRRQENRALFVAIFRYLGFVGQRACHRTALEFCKLLLNLDPDDPLAVTLLIDFYAIRAQQYKWLLRFYAQMEAQRNLSQLPNFAFSVALARFLLLQSAEEEEEGESADEALQNALLAYPATLSLLLDKCGVNTGSCKTASHSFFSKAGLDKNCPAALMNLIQLYVGRAYHVWKDPAVLLWLETNAVKVVERVDAGEGVEKEERERRMRRYQGMPRNVLRHILISEVKDATAALPQELTHAPLLTFDPLPPADSVSSYTRPPRPTRPVSAHDSGNNNSNLISIFLRSLLPNYNVAQQPYQVQAMPPGQVEAARIQLEEAAGLPAGGGAVGGAEGGAAGGGAADLRRSVTSLLDAMRDLLSNINVPDMPQDADDDDTDRGEN